MSTGHPSEFSRIRLQFAQSRDAAGLHRQPVVRAIHPEPGRARRAPVLKEPRHETLLPESSHRCCCRCGSSPAHAALNVFATVPEWGALAEELGGDKVKVYTATTALQDPHHVEARPSLIARARSADLVVATGAELEVGWLPLVLQQAGNPEGAARHAGLLRGRGARAAARQAHAPRSRRGRHPPAGRSAHPDRPAQHRARRRSRSPHAWRELDPANAAYYRSALQGVRRALAAPRSRAGSARRRRSRACRRRAAQGASRISSRGSAWSEVAALEPKPGMEPTTAHLSEVLATLQRQPAKMVLRAAYQSDRASQWLARAREDHAGRAAVHRRRHRRREGPLRPVRRHDRAAARRGAQ